MRNMSITRDPPGGAFAKGGNNKMHSWSGSGKQEPGQSAQEGTGGRRDGTADGGASGVASSSNVKQGREMNQKHGSNTDYAGRATAGTSGPTKTGGDKNGFAEGGKTSMHGNRGSQAAQGGCTCPQ